MCNFCKNSKIAFHTVFIQAIASLCEDKASIEYESLFLATEVMTDIAQLCNVCMRDRENLDVMIIVEANLANVNLVRLLY